MGQHIQLVLLASIVASCISYSIDSTKIMSVPEPPVEPLESELSEFPAEFMNKLIASLRPEELKELQKPITLGKPKLVDRDGNIPCHSLEDTRNYNIVKATDGLQYYVITKLTTKLQPVIHYACDKHGSNDNKCEPNNPEKFYGYCCRQHKKTTALYVIPVPKSRLYVHNQHFFLKDTHEKYENFTMIQKDVLMNSYCSCDLSKTAIKESYSCPNPESNSFI